MTQPHLILIRLCAIPLLALLFWTIGHQNTHAKLMICNETGESRNVAIGYKDKGEWVSEGWWNVDAQKCVTPLKKDLQSSFYYYRATTKGGDFDGQDFIFCTTSKAFTIRGDKDCQKRGFDRAEFRELKLIKGTLGFRLTLNNKTIYEDGEKPVEEPAKKAKPALAAKKAKPAQSVKKNQPTKPVKKDQPAKPGAYGKPYKTGGIYRGCVEVYGSRRCFSKLTAPAIWWLRTGGTTSGFYSN